MKLNPEKCTFGVEEGKFLGFMLTHRGRGQPRQMSSHSRHEKSEKNQGGATTPRALDNPLKIHPPTGREDETDGPATSEGRKVQLGQQM